MTEKKLDDVRCPACGGRLSIHDYQLDEESWMLSLDLYCYNDVCQQDNLPEEKRSIDCVGVSVVIRLSDAKVVKETRR